MNIQDEIKSNFTNDYLKGRVNIHFTHNYLNEQLLKIITPFLLSPAQFNVLRILRGQFPKTSSVGLIKERMIDKSSDISRIIDRMLSKKLVIRKECKVDRRQKEILISQLGLDILNQIDKAENLLTDSMKNLTQKEIKLLSDLLDKIRL